MRVHATTNVPYFAKGTENGWDTVTVKSKSRPGVIYTVDVTHGRCSCPAWIFSNNKSNGLRPMCKHLKGLHFREVGNEMQVAEPQKVGQGQKVKEKMS